MSEEITGQIVGAAFEDGTFADCDLEDCECPEHGGTPPRPGVYITVKLDDENANVQFGPVRMKLQPIFKEPEAKVYPALTAEEFNRCSYYSYGDVDFVESEEGSYLYAYGHIPLSEMSEAATNILGAGDHATRHLYAVVTSPEPDWYLSVDAKYEDHPDRFPITVVTL